jgi:hypothetical protein
VVLSVVTRGSRPEGVSRVAPGLSVGPPATAVGVVGVIFTAVWVGTVATVTFAVFTLHRFMHREKRREIQRLNGRSVIVSRTRGT